MENIYKIQHVARTLAQIHLYEDEAWKTDFTIDWFIIKQWWYSLAKWPYGNAWVVEKEIKAINWLEAINIFRKEFDLVAQKLSLISQCYLNFLSYSFLVEKLNDNEYNIFFLNIVRDREAVPLHFWVQHLKDYKLLNELWNNEAFKYLQEYNNTIWYYPKAMLLCSSLEALAWKETKINEEWVEYQTYDKDKMIEIL